MMSSRTLKFHSRQRGIAAVMAVIILITAVIFVLSQTRLITGSNSVDNTQQMDSTAALFIAESGLELARSILLSKLDITDPATCAAAAPAGATSIGRGSFTLAATLLPAPTGCSASGRDDCTNCQVISTGTVNNANRAVTQTFRLLKAAYCNTATTRDCHNQNADPLATTPVPPRWALTLPVYPSSSSIGIGVFNTAANYTTCFAGALGCNYPTTGNNKWTIASPSSTPVILGMGNTVSQVATVTGVKVFQRLNANVDVVETGALFPFAATGNPVVGAYSDTVSSVGDSTIGDSSHLGGKTTDGALTASSWCYNATQDVKTLVMGFSAHSSNAKSDHLTNVVFNTIPLTNVMKSPSRTATVDANTGAANDVYSEIWYKSNPAYTYGKWITGQILAVPLIIDIQPKNNSYYGHLTTAATGFIGIGDIIDTSSCNAKKTFPLNTQINGFNFTAGSTSCNVTTPGLSYWQLPANTVICFNQPAGTDSSCNNATVTGSNGAKLEVKTVNGGSSDLIYSDVNHGFGETVARSDLTPNNPLTIGAAYPTIDTGFIGTYAITSTPPTSPVGTNYPMVVGGATVTGNQVTLASGATLPTQNTVLAVRTVPGMTTAQNGLLASNPYVTSNGSNPLTLWSSATTNSIANGAVLCGGTCAFFAPTPGGTTAFGFGISPTTPATITGTDYWAAGFTCLNNVGAPTMLSGSGSALNGAVWQEQVK